MEVLLKLFEVVFPVFFVVGIGYYLGKKNPKIDTDFITNFAANIGTPGLIFFSITSTGVTFELFLLFFAYGAKGFGVASAVAAIIMLLHFTVGVFLAKKKFDANLIFKTPAFYAILFSVSFLYFELNPPTFLINLTMLLSYATIFLVLMSLGIALTRLKIFDFKNAVISSFSRVIIGPVIGYLVIKFFNLNGYAAGSLLIQCSMPSAVLTYLVGSMYSKKKVADNIASMIVVSTIMSFFTIPIVVFFALKYFN